MITVPEIIKDRYHRDHCYKNIRIHFPNGERTDINNSLIVKDSVSFTESLCSQNQLKFGLCEASVFECETVGVGNIKGATIEVSVEIEAPPSVEGVVWKSEIQKYVYPIPYGTFVVDSCKREADMQHRKIVAYGGTASFKSSTCIYEKYYKRYYGGSVEAYTPNGFLFAIENSANGSGGIYDITEIPSVDDEFWYFNYAFPAKRNIVYHCVMNFEVKKWTFDNTSNPIADLDNLFYWTKDDINDLREEQDKFVDYINSIARNEHSWRDFFQDNPTTLVNVKYNDKDVWKLSANKPPELKTPLLVYPYFNGCKAELYFIYKYIFRGYLDGDHQYLAFTYESDPFSENMSLKKMALKSDYSFLNNYRISFPVESGTSAGNPYQRPIFGNLLDGSVYNPQDVLNPAIELLGRFGTVKRDNSFEMIDIKRQFGLDPDSSLYPGESLYPEGVTGGELLPADYQSCWYDDDYTKPYGAIQCIYKNTNNEDINYIMYLTGFTEETDPNTYQIYDLNDNSYIKAGVWSQSDIEDFCNSIASAIEGVQYMPVDFVGRGLPYVEAGDTFEILTKRNDSITTIVLNRTITGEQTLTDSYKSV